MPQVTAPRTGYNGAVELAYVANYPATADGPAALLAEAQCHEAEQGQLLAARTYPGTDFRVNDAAPQAIAQVNEAYVPAHARELVAVVYFVCASGAHGDHLLRLVGSIGNIDSDLASASPDEDGGESVRAEVHLDLVTADLAAAGVDLGSLQAVVKANALDGDDSPTNYDPRSLTLYWAV